jgi:predicted AlkP superfamily pyrophosphatase or phosphodiesterase
MKRLLPILLLLAATVARAAVEHVLVIGCDGLGSLAFNPSNAPVMHRLMREGSWTLRARGVMPTSSSPNWASMIMGAGPEQHGITSNEWETNRFEIPALEKGPDGLFPTMFRSVREARRKAGIAVVHDWDGFGRLVERRSVDLVAHVKGSPLTATAAADVIRTNRPTLLFVHFDDVDHAGHTFGWKSPQYSKSVDMVDTLNGDLMKALKDAGIADSTLVLITADHGGVGTKHGGPTIEELEIPWIVHGPGVARGHEIRGPVNTYDTAPTVLHALKIKAPGAWIGRPVREAFGR